MANIFSFRHRRTAKKTSRPVFVTKTTAWRNHFRRVSLFVFVSIRPDYGTKRVMVLVGPFLRRPVVMYISPNRFSGSTREVSALSADRIAGVTFRDVTLPPTTVFDDRLAKGKRRFRTERLAGACRLDFTRSFIIDDANLVRREFVKATRSVFVRYSSSASSVHCVK